MGFNFPNSPTVDQVFNPGSGMPVYRWDGEKWVSGSASVQALYVGDTAPVGAAPGSLWWNSANAQLYIYYADVDSTQWVSVVSAPAPAKLSKNYVVNGAMMVSQENGATALTVNVGYPVDMTYVQFGSGTFTHQQVALRTPAGSPNRLRVTINTMGSIGTSDFLLIDHNIEGLRVADLMFGTAAAKTITIQFGFKGPAGNYAVSLRGPFSNRSYITPFTIAAGEANTDVVRSVTIPGDVTGAWNVDNTAAFSVGWACFCGSGFQTTPNAWQAGNFLWPTGVTGVSAAGSVFELFDVGLYEGAVAPLFQVPDYASELALCRRYFESVLVAGSTGLTAFIPTQSIARTGLYYSPKRAAPTFLVTATNINVNCTAGNIAGVSIATNPPITTTFAQFDVTVAGTPLTIGQAASVGCGSPFSINARL